MEWVLKVFQLKERSLMLTILKSFVFSLVEYFCQLWNPWKAKDIHAIEAIQRTFTYQNHCSTTLKSLGRISRTQIILSPETP